ncbi:MAG TPA: hypothetical protein VGW78_06690 [Candidatus Babeliales bacterium]|jgi:lysyl-tRNA synthetase class I|nr:hypothetical protein [Candidatus Babeliales bacterium]
MSFKSEIDQLRKVQAEYPDENCIQYIKEIIRNYLHKYPCANECCIKYDACFNKNMHQCIKNYLVEQGFCVKDYIYEDYPYAHSDPIYHTLGIILLFNK